MQFLFGSDKDHGYGFLYTEGKKTEAEDVKRAISFTVEAGVDAYGMVTFGANSNRPLFFRAKKDESYQREAYYIHGIYRDASPDYFKNEYLRDVFTNYIDQAKVDALRAGQNPDLSQTVNESLLAGSERFAIDQGLLKELLVRLYQGEKLLLSIPDESYNGDITRCVIAHIFSYLVPSLRKSCGYVSGILNIGSMKGVAIRIVPESKLAGTNEPRFNLAARGHVCGLNSEFTSVVDELIALGKEDRARVFEWYETLFNGFGSTYQPKKYLDFYKSLHGDVAVAEKIIDTYLAPIADPSVETIPKYAVDALRSKYANGAQVAGIFEISTVAELAAPLSVLQKNVASAKKVYLFCDSPASVYRYAFERVISTIGLDDASLVKLYEGMSAFINRKKEENKRYQIEFESAVEALYAEQLSETGRIGACWSRRKVLFDAINTVFAKQQSRIEEAQLTNLIGQCDIKYKTFYEETKQLGYDLHSVAIRKMQADFAAHNEKHKPLTGIASIGVEQIKMLDETSKALCEPKSPNADAYMAEMVKTYSDCPHIVNLYAAKYALNISNTLGKKGNPAFLELSQRAGAIMEVSSIIFNDDPLSAIKLAVTYAPVSEALIALLSLVRTNHTALDNVDSKTATSFMNSASQVIYKRLKEEGISPEAAKAIDNKLKQCSPKNKDSSVKLTGNVKTFYEAVGSAWSAFRSNKPYKAKKKNNKALIWIIAAVVALLVLIGGIVGALFLTGVLGGDDESSSGEKTEESDNGSDKSDNSDSSASGDSSDASGSDNSGSSSDIALIGEIGEKSNVSLLDTAQNGTKWTYVLILVEEGNVYTVADKLDAPSGFMLEDGQVALAFFKSSTKDDADSATVAKMIETAKQLKKGDKLERTKEDSFVKVNASDEESKPEESKPEEKPEENQQSNVDAFDFKIEFVDSPVNDTHVVMATKTLDYTQKVGTVGYAILLESCGDNQYKIVKIDGNNDKTIDFASEISVTKIAIIIHINEDIGGENAEEAWVNLKKLKEGDILTASGALTKNTVLSYTPA